MADPVFIVFEGGEGSGKSTQARALYSRLRKVGYNVVYTHEPGGTMLGEKLRRWVKWGRDVTIPAELLLFLASRSQLVTKVIRPALEKGSIVVCDRFAASTIAYQGYGRGMDLGLLESLNNFVTDGLAPDLVFLMDLDAEEGLSRKKRKWDAFEREEFIFHQKVRDGYMEIAIADPEKWVVINAELPEVQVGEIIWEQVRDFLTYGRRSVSPATSSL
ncbi:MAG: dTMP kinase [Dehalococcoidia bacterium]|jgi:dTMP kinase|nr:dTMP kinase [Dehalococcoidia bacterium]